MKKRILLVAVVQLFLTLNSCSSDSGDNTKDPVVIAGEIKADYIADVSLADDFVIDNNNIVYKIGQEDITVKLKKIDLEGKISVLKILDFTSFYASALSITKEGTVLLVAPSNEADRDKIFRFENNFTVLNPFYTMKPISSPFANKIRLSAIGDNKDNTYFVFDYNNRQIKRFVPELSTDVLVAGSEKKAIEDGTGLNASFGSVSKIVSQNNILYVIDNLYTGANPVFVSSNIRKLEYVNNEWVVSTLISNSTNKYLDIAFDPKNELYVLVENKGIAKLNLQNNTLSVFKDGDLLVGKETVHKKSSYKNITMMKIKDNDLYIILDYDLVKISDFQSKLSK
ncbi:hypothetical protein BC749_1011436 [Flavobacterium araucananum]|uniref:Glutamine cyclotransferase n=1 Tax=Flavobacterium araucananum TaxID=946678 RepID=A0A227NVB2_9FLAO|nr:hypothetical protein [Flavobacterium araucananum]OXG00765.1 hypothetical protein B0A64_19260 [Flavobacterium araucananum]PWK03337.1 hypothetical protein BC749_1011436 [Flavobacterium araucananum]